MAIFVDKSTKVIVQGLTGGHFSQGFLGLEDGQRAVEPPGVEFAVDVHGRRDSRRGAETR